MREINEQENDRNIEMFQNFIEAIKQQKLNPGFLLFEKELFDSIKELLSEQRNKLKDYVRYQNQNEIKVAKTNFRYMIYNAEIQKIDYLLKMYLKIRLKKIQIFCFHSIKSEHEAEKLLSTAEMKFLKKYADMRYQYYKDNVFKHLVKNYRDFKGIEIVFAKNEDEQRERKAFIDTKQSQIQLKAPNYNEYVFAEILTNPKQIRFGIDVPISNGNTEQMQVIPQGAIIYGPYKIIQQRLSNKHYRLI